jgi:hypothetical protein
MNIRNVLICTALALAPGCSKSADSQIDQMVTMMEDMGKAIEGAAGDCTKMADSVGAVVAKYDVKAMKEAAEKMKGDKTKAEEMMKKYGDRMQKVMPQMMGMMKCADDPKMKELSKKLEGMM